MLTSQIQHFNFFCNLFLILILFVTMSTFTIKTEVTHTGVMYEVHLHLYEADRIGLPNE